MVVLPSYIFSLIYQYDSTYHVKYKLVLDNLNKIFALLISTLRIKKINKENYHLFCSYNHEIINNLLHIEVTYENFEIVEQQEQKIYICISQYILWKLEKKEYFVDLSWFQFIPVTKLH